MKTVFLDESGYTGEDLLNVEQPVFVLASTTLSEEECRELKSEYFPQLQAEELKHSNLIKSKRHRQAIIELLRELAKKNSYVKFQISHKQYVVVTKIVDILIEEIMRKMKIDLYEFGGNIAYSNMLFYALNESLEVVYFNRILKAFQRMCRTRTEKSYNEFFNLFLRFEFPQDIEEIISPIRMAYSAWGYSSLKKLPNNVLEIAGSCAFLLISSWSEEIGDEFIVTHDNSNNMIKVKDAWNRLTSSDVPKTVVGQDRRKITFPIKVFSTNIEDSKDWAALQIADILAGAYCRCATWIVKGNNSSDKYAAELAEILLTSFSVNPMWPEMKVTPEELGTVGSKEGDAVDFISSLLDGESI